MLTDCALRLFSLSRHRHCPHGIGGLATPTAYEAVSDQSDLTP